MKKILLSFMVFGLMFSFGALVHASGFSFTRNLSFGSKGEDVKMLQQILKDKSFLNGIADGKFGNMTKVAVKKYQTANGLGADGKVGPKTRAKLNLENINSSQSVTVTSPNGGEQIILGQHYAIKWDTTGFSATDKVRISLKNDSIFCAPGLVGRWTEFGIVNQPIQNTGNYIWNTNLKMFGDAGPNTVPVTVGNNYKIHVEALLSDSIINVSDYSDNEFSITSNCPQYSPPAPGWCSNGTVVGPTIDPSTGCYSNVTCVPSVLQTIYSHFSDGYISECTYQGAQYYTAGLNAYDGGETVYDMSGNIVGSSGGFTGQITGIQPTNCNRIYASYPNIWHYPAINTYNLH